MKNPRGFSRCDGCGKPFAWPSRAMFAGYVACSRACAVRRIVTVLGGPAALSHAFGIPYRTAQCWRFAGAKGGRMPPEWLLRALLELQTLRAAARGSVEN